MSETPAAPIRQLILVLGDQLDHGSTAFDGFDPAQDVVWMAEATEESTHVWSAKQRIAIFLSAMRHFAAELRERGLPLRYTRVSLGTSALVFPQHCPRQRAVISLASRFFCGGRN